MDVRLNKMELLVSCLFIHGVGEGFYVTVEVELLADPSA